MGFGILLFCSSKKTKSSSQELNEEKIEEGAPKS